MAIYRVGTAGATVFDSEGREIGRLLPGQAVVEGTIDAAGALSAVPSSILERRRTYADKMRRPGRDLADKARP